MSTVASRRARDVLRNTTKVIAIELLSSAQALSFRLDEGVDVSLGQGVSQGLKNVTHVLQQESHPYTTIGEQIELLAKAIQNGSILDSLPNLLQTSDVDVDLEDTQ